jgi:hypothetical protein
VFHNQAGALDQIQKDFFPHTTQEEFHLAVILL